MKSWLYFTLPLSHKAVMVASLTALGIAGDNLLLISHPTLRDNILLKCDTAIQPKLRASHWKEVRPRCATTGGLPNRRKSLQEGKFIMSEYVVKALSLEEFLSRHPMPLATLSRLLGVSEDAARSWSCGRRNPLPQILTHLATLDEKLRENPELRGCL